MNLVLLRKLEGDRGRRQKGNEGRGEDEGTDGRGIWMWRGRGNKGGRSEGDEEKGKIEGGHTWLNRLWELCTILISFDLPRI